MAEWEYDNSRHREFMDYWGDDGELLGWVRVEPEHNGKYVGYLNCVGYIHHDTLEEAKEQVVAHAVAQRMNRG